MQAEVHLLESIQNHAVSIGLTAGIIVLHVLVRYAVLKLIDKHAERRQMQPSRKTLCAQVH